MIAPNGAAAQLLDERQNASRIGTACDKVPHKKKAVDSFGPMRLDQKRLEFDAAPVNVANDDRAAHPDPND
jgi:hypothetical protein